MGWLYNEELTHVSAFVSEKLSRLRAHTYALSPAEIERWTQGALENEHAEPLGIFYIAKTGPPKEQDSEYIGVMLIDFMREGAHEKTERAGEMIWTPDSDVPIPVEHPLVQQWGYKPVPAAAGPAMTNCPLEWLDRVLESGTEIERRWRRRVKDDARERF